MMNFSFNKSLRDKSPLSLTPVAIILLVFLMLPYQAVAENLLVFSEISEHHHRDGSPSGYLYEVVRQVMRKTDVAGEFRTENWKRSYALTLRGPNIALFPTTRTPEREMKFYWIGPLLKIHWAFYAKKGSGIVINSLDDARKIRRIGTYAEDAREKYLLDNGFTNLESVRFSIFNWRMLDAGRIDLVIGSDMGLNQIKQSGEFPDDAFEEVYIIKQADLYLAMSKNIDTSILAAWNRAFKDFQINGQMASLRESWFTRSEN